MLRMIKDGFKHSAFETYKNNKKLSLKKLGLNFNSISFNFCKPQFPCH